MNVRPRVGHFTPQKPATVCVGRAQKQIAAASNGKNVIPTEQKPLRSPLRRTFLAIAPFGCCCNRLLTDVLLFGALSLASAQITWDASPSGGTALVTAFELLQDTATPTPSGQYIGLRFSSAAPLTNVYARATVAA